jgi:hypothetical protein
MIPKGISQNLIPNQQNKIYTLQKELQIEGAIFVVLIWTYESPLLL